MMDQGGRGLPSVSYREGALFETVLSVVIPAMQVLIQGPPMPARKAKAADGHDGRPRGEQFPSVTDRAITLGWAGPGVDRCLSGCPRRGPG